MKVIGKIIKGIATLISTIVMIIVCTFLYARFVEPSMLVSKNITVSNERIETPFKIVFFSDTHFGEMYAQENIEKIVEKINQQEADIVIFGGDFFDDYSKEKEVLNLDYMEKQLGNIEANYAKYAIWGNHDCGGGSSRIYKEMMESGGFTVLRNESRIIDDFNLEIRGIDDYLLGNPDTSTKMFQSEYFNILLSHAPDIVDEMDGSKTDIMIAGHSHGGQVFMPKVTSQILPDGAQKYSKGIYLFKNDRDSKLFVSKGIGTTKMPYRFLNVPEIVVIECYKPQY